MSRLAEDFLISAAQKSADLTHRATIKRNMDSYDAAVAKGKTRFADWEAARTRAAQIKSEGLQNLAALLEQFEQKITVEVDGDGRNPSLARARKARYEGLGDGPR